MERNHLTCLIAPYQCMCITHLLWITSEVRASPSLHSGCVQFCVISATSHWYADHDSPQVLSVLCFLSSDIWMTLWMVGTHAWATQTSWGEALQSGLEGVVIENCCPLSSCVGWCWDTFQTATPWSPGMGQQIAGRQGQLHNSALHCFFYFSLHPTTSSPLFPSFSRKELAIRPLS